MGTKEGAAKAALRMKEKYGEDYFRNIGAVGGRWTGPRKGFGNDNRSLVEKLLRKPKRAVVAGRLGGTISRKG